MTTLALFDFGTSLRGERLRGESFYRPNLFMWSCSALETGFSFWVVTFLTYLAALRSYAAFLKANTFSLTCTPTIY